MQRCINALIESDFHVRCFSRSFNNNDFYNPNLKVNQFYRQDNISTLFKKSWLFYAEYNLRLFIKLLLTKQDIIYAVDSDTLLSSTFVKLIKNNKLIYDAHEYFEQSPEIIKKSFIQKIWNLITHFGIRNSDLCITVSHTLGIELKKVFHKNFVIIKNIPSFTTEIPINYSSRQKIIWYQGVLNTGRGLELMIDSMCDLPDYTFHLAGEGDLSQTLRKRVLELKLETRVIFHGMLSKTELEQLNRNAFLGINLLSNNSLNYYYSLANRTFDYIHAGLPAIHMNFPEYQMLLKEYKVGVTIELLNKQELIEAIRKFEHQKTYEFMIAETYKASKILNWQNEKQKLVNALQNLNLLD